MCAHVRFPTLSSGSENHKSAPKKMGWVPWFCRENPLLDLWQVPHSVEAWGPQKPDLALQNPHVIFWHGSMFQWIRLKEGVSCAGCAYGFPMVSLWFSDGFPLGNLWFPDCFPMISYGFPMVFLWFPMGFLWFSWWSYLISRGEATQLLKRFEEAKKLIQDLGDWDTAETSDLQLLKSSLF